MIRPTTHRGGIDAPNRFTAAALTRLTIHRGHALVGRIIDPPLRAATRRVYLPFWYPPYVFTGLHSGSTGGSSGANWPKSLLA
jgi:hypothetical protein